MVLARIKSQTIKKKSVIHGIISIPRTIKTKSRARISCSDLVRNYPPHLISILEADQDCQDMDACLRSSDLLGPAHTAVNLSSQLCLHDSTFSSLSLLFSRSVVSDSCDPVDCSLPGSSVYGMFQARILEWVAISFSRGSSQPRN